ncbi:MAG TPA: DciA family protein [Devosiaceae bacterium]|jgi:hypothetical protein|nr:DciA family protein [Devosiaceae bacterium]
MAEKPQDKKPKEFKRLNRTVGVGEAISGALDPALKRRGFASRDIITHWRAMAPKPYDQVAMPDKLAWPRGERSAQGATLYLRCIAGHQLALAHEAPRIAAAVNRYFGYVLVDHVRLSVTPFTPGSAEKRQVAPTADPASQALVAEAVGKVEDARLREALRELGLGIAANRR